MGPNWGLKSLDVDAICKHPAADNFSTYGTGYVYFVKDEMIVGKGRRYIGIDHRMEIKPYDDAKSFFADDLIYNELQFGFWYDKYTGEPCNRFSDEPENRHKGTTIIGAYWVEFGLVPLWMGNIRNIRDYLLPHVVVEN